MKTLLILPLLALMLSGCGGNWTLSSKEKEVPGNTYICLSGQEIKLLSQECLKNGDDWLPVYSTIDDEFCAYKIICITEADKELIK